MSTYPYAVVFPRLFIGLAELNPIGLVLTYRLYAGVFGILRSFSQYSNLMN
jgi:hypothetical protein